VAVLLRSGFRSCGRGVPGDQQFDHVWILDCGTALLVQFSGAIVRAIRRCPHAERSELDCELRDDEFDLAVYGGGWAGDGYSGGVVCGVCGEVGVAVGEGCPGNAIRSASYVVAQSCSFLFCDKIDRAENCS